MNTTPRPAPAGLRMVGMDKSFGGNRVLRDLTLTAHPGRVYALLGPNGAGKSTTLAIALGLLRADAGHVEVLGEPWSRASLAHIGASINGPALFGQLSARQNLRVHCLLTGTHHSAIDAVLRTVGLEDAGRKRAGRFSMGMKMRLSLAMALLTDPEVLILDEPQNGLDPQGIIDLRTLLRGLADAGRTVVVSSHQLGEMARMADDVGVLSRGTLVHEGPLATLAHPDDGVGLEAAYLRLVGEEVTI